MRNKHEVLVKTLINKMFEIAGHDVTFDDIKERKDDWYRKWTMTEEQQKEWLDWGTNLIKTKLRFPAAMAQREMNMINLNWGLMIKI